MPEKDDSPLSLLKAMDILRSVPLWVLLGLAVTAGGILFALLSYDDLAGLNVKAFREAWGVWVAIVSASLAILAIFRLGDILLTTLHAHHKERKAARILKFVPILEGSWWHLAEQRDGRILSQLHISCQVSNLTSEPVLLIRARPTRPRAKVETSMVMLPAEGSPFHSASHPVPARGTVTAGVTLMVQGALARQGHPATIDLDVIDQFGEPYHLRRLVLDTRDKRIPPPTLKERLQTAKLGVNRAMVRFHLVEAPPSIDSVMPWGYEDAEYINMAQAILREERRNYAARNRTKGQLGSLNVGLQSEPNGGWTKVGDVPPLLWPRDQAKIVSSENLQRILDLAASLNQDQKYNLESFLLQQLSKDSDFADVGYFIFLFLHRMGRTIDALQTAQTFLKGDRGFGYSNVLGVLSALFSHEYFLIAKDQYPTILGILAKETEHDFKLRDKINLASLTQ